MKRHILFGLSLLMAFPVCVSAQDDFDEDYAGPARTVKKVTIKKYETRTVKGCVLDAATNKPVSGAIVKASGVDGYSVLTDDNGKYELKVPVFSSSIYVSSPDYNAVTVGLLNGESQKPASMYPKTFASDYTEEPNNMNVVSASGFQYSNAINIKEEVQKQMGAYVYSTSRNGTPGIGNTMFIQGLNSLNANAQPLVVVDGVIVEQQYNAEMLHQGFFNDVMSNINPADIENVEVLRNGTALYGARGANGVIEITTRRGHSMKTLITASAAAGVSFEPEYYKMMHAEQYRGYVSDLLGTTNTQLTDFKFMNSDPDYYYYNIYHNNTDWKKKVYRNAFTQNYGINVEGGDDVAMYNLSVGYTGAQSTMEYNDMSRLNIRFNSDIKLTDRFSVSFDASFSNLTRDIRDDGAPTTYSEGTPTAPSFLAYAKAPFMNPYAYGDGRFSSTVYDIAEESYLDEALQGYRNYNYKLGNPWAFNEYAEAENKNHFENSFFNISITPKYTFKNNITLSEHFTYALVNTNEMYYIPVNGAPSFYVESVSAYRKNLVSSLASKQNSLHSDTRIDWKNRFKAHDVRVMGGLRLDFETYTKSRQFGYNTGSDKTPFMSGSLANKTATGIDNTWRNIDLYLQGNYNYLGRYFAQVNVTASGSSRFGENAKGGIKALNAKWGIFPSIQASWVMSNEPWFNVSGVDYLRITAGFDVSGNDDIDVFARKSYFSSNLFLNAIAALAYNGIGNNEISWETTRRFNAGFEAKFINNRITLGLNYFNSYTNDLLALQELGVVSGVQSYWNNRGSLKNEGFDVAFRAKAISTKNWSWEFGASVGQYKNTIKDLGLADGETSIVSQVANANILTKEGCAANLFYGYKTHGVYATTEQAQKEGLYVMAENGIDKLQFGAGDMIFQDVNRDKEINEKDMVIIGDPNPDIYGNIFTALQWKNFKLDCNFTYSVGNDIYNYMRSQLEGGSRFMNQTTALTQRWVAEGQRTSIPKATFQDPMGNSRFSDRWIEDGSYLKLKSVTLSYNLPLSSSYIQGLQFWIQGNNLFTLTNYTGTDPEVSATNAVIGQGIDLGRVAASRSVIAGVKINL